MKKTLLGLLKYAVSLSIIGYLFHKAAEQDAFAELVEQPKQWGVLLAAVAAVLTGVMMTFFRWFLLVRALGLRFSFRDAVRLGFLGFLFTFFTVGVVGGDVLKAYFLARQQPRRKTEAVASIVVDRMIGLYALFVLGCLAILLIPLDTGAIDDVEQLARVQWILRVTLTVTAVATAGIVLLVLTTIRGGALLYRIIGRLPGHAHLERVVGALRIYRRKLPLLVLAGVMSVGNHSFFALGVYLVARGLPGEIPSLGTHFVIVPLSLICNVLPLPGGLGALEYALDFLYRGVSSAAVAERHGFVVALGYRVVTLLIASIGVMYYLFGRSEVKQLMAEAERTRSGGVDAG